MARPWVLVSLLLLIVFTSQLEWKQQFGNEIEASPNISQRDQQQHSSNREEVVKEKIILSQEKNIQKLNELVQSLREQLQHCRSENYIVNSTAIPLTEHLNGV
ncbi:hypothetical protein POPTR_016G073500v4 [Populus trichocarpa]|uniref:Uncharacterized protein n=1 Tax=Populus trichocarpa TaxID=3694 RepID=A0A2K1XC73_POPTR|nr:uncharacterized protein LOC18106187 [Populus trichocarpa]XP_052303754.1 uncharacterized protein LOC18106187 [Populus trichocarpa]XP_052303755.1 uncharacterized protein LOC18106187 [Populus trichocarpa]PNS98373.1 hypothetical protein POPTR_016G073500v4 [Populus trichocarpa]PNS98374.1 hypothetical protein POPTR_016G073500v4 [Populus trichocarpa]